MTKKKEEENKKAGAILLIALVLLFGLILINANGNNAEDLDGNENIERYDREKKHGGCTSLPEQRAMGFRCECYEVNYMLYNDAGEPEGRDPNYVGDSIYWPTTICDCWYTYDYPVHTAIAEDTDMEDNGT
jgi:hypothetical protein